MSRNSYGWGFASFSLCMCSMQRALLMALVFLYHIQHSSVTGRFICYVTLLGAAWLLQLQWLVMSFLSHCWSASRVHWTQLNFPELLALRFGETDYRRDEYFFFVIGGKVDEHTFRRFFRSRRLIDVPVVSVKSVESYFWVLPKRPKFHHKCHLLAENVEFFQWYSWKF